jgi:hypothetical protein
MLFCFCLPESPEKAGEAGKLSVNMRLPKRLYSNEQFYCAVMADMALIPPPMTCIGVPDKN